MSQKGKLIIAVIACFLPLVGIAAYTWRADDKLREAYKEKLFSSMPYRSGVEVKARLDQIQTIADNGISDIEKFIMLQRELELIDIYCIEMNSLGLVGQALRDQGGKSWSPGPDDSVIYLASQMRARDMANHLWRSVKPQELLYTDEMEQAKLAHPSHFLGDHIPHADHRPLFLMFVLGYALSVLCSRRYIHIRIREVGGKVWLAMAGSIRYWYFQLFWPHLLVREYDIDPRRQLRQAMQFAGAALSALISVTGAFGQTKKPRLEDQPLSPQPITWVVGQEYLNRYHGLNGGNFHPRPVATTSLTAALPNGCILNLWHSGGLDDTSLSSNFGDEVDVSAACTKALGKTNVRAGLVLFDIVPIARVPSGDLLQPELHLSRPIARSTTQELSGWLWLRYPFPIRAETPKAGLFVHYGATHTWQLSPRLKLEQNAEVLHDVHGAFGFDSAWIAGWYGRLRIKVGEKFTILAPTFRLSSPLTHVNDGRKPMATVGMGWEYAF